MLICSFFQIAKFEIFISDNAPNMMSPDVGAHQYIEGKLGYPTQRLACLLHFGELPPKNLIKSKFVDGATKGPGGTGGELGIAIKALPEKIKGKKLPYVQFPPIPTYVRDDFDIGVFKGRADLESLYYSCKAIGKNKFSSMIFLAEKYQKLWICKPILFARFCLYL